MSKKNNKKRPATTLNQQQDTNFIDTPFNQQQGKQLKINHQQIDLNEDQTKDRFQCNKNQEEEQKIDFLQQDKNQENTIMTQLNLQQDFEFNNPQEVLDCNFNPREINFREDEKGKIQEFLENSIKQYDSSNKCLMITGQPGTGKTLLMNNILKNIQNQKLVNKKVKILQLNAMRFMSQIEFLQNIYKSLQPNKQQQLKNIKDQKKLIEQIQMLCIESQEKEILILMVDEFDQLFKKQNLEELEIFCLGDYLILLGISNTMEMLQKIQESYNISDSRVNLDKIQNIVFEPYSQEKLIQIVSSRTRQIENYLGLKHQVFEDITIKRAAQVVLNRKGDIRQLLEICQMALDNKIQQQKRKSIQNPEDEEDYEQFNSCEMLKQITQPIKMQDLDPILNIQSFENRIAKTILSLPRDLQLTLIAVYRIENKNSSDQLIREISVQDVRNALNKIKEITQIQIDKTQVVSYLDILQSYQIINIKKPTKTKFIQGNHEFYKIKTCLDLEVVKKLYQEDSFFSKLF